MKQQNRDSEKGWVLVTVALSLVALVAFAALGTDVGVLYSARTSAQEVVDAAALAGVSTFVLNPTAAQPATAINYATSAATNQSILGKPVAPGDVSVSVNVAARRVTVNFSRQEDTYFARVIGFDNAEVAVVGRAEASGTAIGAKCVKPFFLPNTVLLPSGGGGGGGHGGGGGGSAPCNACDPANPEYNQVVMRDGSLTAYAMSRLGQQFTIRPTQPSQALQPGQFYSLAIGGTGAQVYRDNIATCSQEAVSCQQCYLVEPGNMQGPTHQGIDDLVGDPPDEFHAVADYGPDHSDTSRSLVVVPIWDICGDPTSCGEVPFCPAGRYPGGGRFINIKVVGFGLVFVDGFQGNAVQARLINVFPCSSGGGGGEQTGPYSVPIRLIRES